MALSFLRDSHNTRQQPRNQITLDMDNTVNVGDLVLTADGYYGIVVDVQSRSVFLGNGLEEVMDADGWSRLRRMPIIEGTSGVANFAELLRYVWCGKPHDTAAGN